MIWVICINLRSGAKFYFIAHIQKSTFLTKNIEKATRYTTMQGAEAQFNSMMEVDPALDKLDIEFVQYQPQGELYEVTDEEV